MLTSKHTYQSGFGIEFATEALPDVLPVGQNSPQKVARGLYAEQLSGTAFTAPRSENRRSWLYRIRPSAVHGKFVEKNHATLCGGAFDQIVASPNQLRWNPFPIPSKACDFIDGLVTIAGNGSSDIQSGMAIHVYLANRSMSDKYFYNADGELLIVPQLGELCLRTEFGLIDVKPGEIAVIPRGVRFTVDLKEDTARGYICENYGALLRLPDLGPIGANGLANTRDFLTPVAAFEDKQGEFELVAKFSGKLWSAPISHSPLDVVAWHGNYAPYKYDLAHFNVMNSVSFDHADPSIFTVLTSPSGLPGTANLDFVIFPPRWMVAENTLRPPWCHRNVMSEYMGLVYGQYDAKAEGFLPGGGSLHNCMSAHGPDVASFEKASNAELHPQKIAATLAFMFETRLPIRPTRLALESPQLQNNYIDCWQDFKKYFTN